MDKDKKQSQPSMDKSKLIALNRQRGGYKGQLTRISTFLDDTEKEPLEYQVKLDSLKKVMEKLDDLKIQYFEVVDDDKELQSHLAEFIELEEEAEKLEVRLRKILLSINNKDKCNEFKAITNGSKNINVKLPDIPLPKFSGHYQEWYSYKEQFVTLIDMNENLSDTQKLYYLKSTLSGSAYDVISGNDSYAALFAALQERFENKRYIVNSHINDILTSNTLVQDSAVSLRSIIDGFQKHIRALNNMGLELNQFSEVLLINIILRKLDKETKKQFEFSMTTSDLPKWNEFIEFLQKRSLALENVYNTHNKPKHPSIDKNPKFKTLVVKSNTNNSFVCALCRANHPIFKCDMFLKLNEHEKYSTAKKLNLCLNCLGTRHRIAQCISKNLCQKCNKKHNTLLHRESADDLRASGNYQTNNLESSSPLNEVDNKSGNHKLDETDVPKSLRSEICLSGNNKSKVLLATCIAYVETSNGMKIPAKAMLDSGSEISCCTREFADSLGLKKKRMNVKVSGISGKITNIKSKVRTNICNKDGSFQQSVDFLIIPKITDCVSAHDINIQKLNLPSDIRLADPDFGKRSKIDILIGAELFYEILGTQRYKISQLLFQETVFGYIVSGTTGNENRQTFCGLIQHSDTLEENIQKFWNTESVGEESSPISREEQLCENHFVSTYQRDNTGRFVVKMPIRENDNILGNSKSIAEKRLNQLWNRLEKTPIMRKLYCDFMEEYENLQHMRKVTGKIEERGSYYLPHHGVFRPEKSTTKLRVVFNASSPTTNGKSLNDILLKGMVNENLYDIMIRFRKHKFVFLADIEKMYRQIVIDKEQRKLLRILWKSNSKAPIEVYELNTVTYGTACAPFLAIRTLNQLAIEGAEKSPRASQVLLNDTYMDDIISGDDTLRGAKELQHQLVQLLQSAGMRLHKWNGNHPELLELVSKKPLDSYSFSENETKALGVAWNPNLDIFTFKVKIDMQEKITKRSILSNIARIFDPLGLVGPVITKAKIFMQELWKLKLRVAGPPS